VKEGILPDLWVAGFTRTLEVHDPERPAEEAWLDPLELEVLRIRTGRKISTVREVALAIGRLGGHLNRKGDGLPGWATLWRGMQTLSVLVEGVRLARKLTHFG